MEQGKHLTFLKHEMQQTGMRYMLLFIVICALFIDYNSNNSMDKASFEYMMYFPFSFLFITFIYTFVVKKYPDFYQIQRILLISSMEVIAAAYVMYLAGALSTFFPSLFLWFIVGYSIRYGLKLGYYIYTLSIVSWSSVLVYSDFWLLNINFGLGWLVGIIIIPLYFFRLLGGLHANLEESEYLSKHDSLTKLPNRFFFDSTLDEYLLRYKNTNKKFALIFFDLDDFKKVNDIYGHAMGDDVLVEIASRINALCSFTSRLGGDEFIAIKKYEDEALLKLELEILLEELSRSYKNIELSSSVGVSLCTSDMANAHELKKHADMAMYKAKKNGKNKYSFYQ